MLIRMLTAKRSPAVTVGTKGIAKLTFTALHLFLHIVITS